MVKVSVIVPTLNEEKYVEPFLKSLKSQMRKRDELLVVDGYSSDKTAMIAKKYTKNVLLMPRLGIGAAKTFGAKRAKNEVVAFLDSDSTIMPGWLDGIREAFENGADVFYGGTMYKTDSEHSRKIFYMAMLKVSSALCDIVHDVVRNAFGMVWVSPNNCAFRKDVFLKAGGYAAVVCEEWDLALRLKKINGIKYHYDAESIVLISDRRFRKNGLIRTRVKWIIAVVGILTKNDKAADPKRYGAVR